MDKRDYVLSVLSTSEEAWTPVQVQKIFFLLDKKLGRAVGGPHFDFSAYDYGPFDAAVYREIEAISALDLASIDKPPFGMRTFRVTSAGVEKGKGLRRTLHPAIQKYVEDLSAWVRRLSFAELVSAIYKEFPDMKANSVFREP